MAYDLYPFPPEREIVVDAGYLGTGRHIIYALVELDVTRARELLRAASAAEGRALSFTAFLAASLAGAIDVSCPGPGLSRLARPAGRLP